MSVQEVPIDTASENVTEALTSPVPTLNADAMKQEPSPWTALSAFGTSEDSTIYFQLMPAIHGFSSRPTAQEPIAANLQLDTIPGVVNAVIAPEARSTSVQITTRPAWRPQLAAARTHEEIIAVLRLFDLNAIADRLGYLRQLVEDDPDEPSMAIESLRALAIFLMGERQLPDPRIGVTPDGLAQIEWRFPTNGILAMEFLSSGLIRFAAISAPAQRGVERLSVNGTLPKDAALEAVRPFTSRLSFL